MKMKPLYLLSILGLCAFATSATAADAKKVTYNEHVMPIFQAKCLGCHNADKARGALDLSTYTAMLEGGGSGEVIKGGDPAGSRLYTLMAHTEEPKMPPNSPRIEEEQLKVVEDWIKGGALESDGSKPLLSKPKVDVSLGSVTRGRPEVAPMPTKPLPLDPFVVTERGTAVTAMATNPWSPIVAIGGQKQILLYNTDTLQLVGILPFKPGTPHVLKFSRNGSLLLAGGGHAGLSGKVVLYNLITGEEVVELGNETDVVLAADISADQEKIALGGPSKVVRIYSTKTGELLKEIRKHTDWVYQIEFSPDAVLLATGDRTGGLFVWEAFSGNEFYALNGHKGSITALSWRDDSNALASGSEDGSVKLWEMTNGSNFKSWNSHGGVLSAQYAHDGHIVTCGRDKVTRLWDGNGGQKRQFPGMADLALATAITHDGKRVITGDWTGTVKVWSAEDGKELGSLSTHPPSLADQVAAATKQKEAAAAAHAAALKAHQASEANVKARTDALNAAKVQVTATQKAAEEAKQTLAKAKQTHAAAIAEQKKARDVLTAAEKEKKPNEELEKLRQAITAADATVKTATDALAAADKAVPATAKAAQDAAKVPAVREAELKAANEQFPKTKAALDQATAQLKTASDALARLEAAATLAKK